MRSQGQCALIQWTYSKSGKPPICNLPQHLSRFACNTATTTPVALAQRPLQPQHPIPPMYKPNRPLFFVSCPWPPRQPDNPFRCPREPNRPTPTPTLFGGVQTSFFCSCTLTPTTSPHPHPQNANHLQRQLPQCLCPHHVTLRGRRCGRSAGLLPWPGARH